MAPALLSGALAEDSRADANLRSAFLDSDFEIVAHTHGKFGKRAAKVLFEIVAQTTEAAKIRTRIARVFAKRRNGHQAAKLQMRHLNNGFGERRQIHLRYSGFAFRRIDLYFD